MFTSWVWGVWFILFRGGWTIPGGGSSLVRDQTSVPPDSKYVLQPFGLTSYPQECLHLGAKEIVQQIRPSIWPVQFQSLPPYMVVF